MKVLVLGGAGTMGAGGAHFLTKFPGVEKIVLSDINKDVVEAKAKEINSPLIETAVVDALNKEELREYAKNFDVVLNCVGPFTKFGVPILETIIEAGVNYVDVCDDHDATTDLLKLHEKAEAAGVTAMICMGTTPGITNMQALRAVKNLDEIENLVICWAVSMLPNVSEEDLKTLKPSQLLSPTAWQHLLHVSSGDIPVWKNGKWGTMPALESGQYVDFAEPLGRSESYFIGHAEPITLVKYLDVKGFSACLGALAPFFMEEIRETARGHKKAKNPPQRPDTPVWVSPEIWEGRNTWGGQAVIAEGKEGDEYVRYTVRYMMGTEEDFFVYNNIGQAIGTYMVGNKMIDKPGVFGPEAILDPDFFFDELVRLQNEYTGDTFTLDTLVPIEREVIDKPTVY